MFKSRYVSYIIIVMLALTFAACSNDDNGDNDDSDSNGDEPAFVQVNEGSLSEGDEIPVPAAEDTILTVTGKIGNANQEDQIVMDLEAIESVGEVEYTLEDPFLEEQVTYRGVLMSDLLRLWGVPEDATELRVVALNDYEATAPIADMYEYPVMFALQMNGEHMPVSTRGPAMLVYPYHRYEFDRNDYNNYWVWQIKSIEVR
ncbi:MAG: molybdopterin-dependent oxidoreductase [Chloroflexi bacterium]|nr:molybdopterin-dependent oxidoreductase [Chloroflexota bacterium]